MLVRDYKVDLECKNEDDETVEDYCKALGDIEMLRVISSLKPNAVVSLKANNYERDERAFGNPHKSSFPFSLGSGSSYGIERGQAFA